MLVIGKQIFLSFFLSFNGLWLSPFLVNLDLVLLFSLYMYVCVCCKVLIKAVKKALVYEALVGGVC